MKLNILKFIGFFLAVVFMASCNQEAFDEYTSVPAAGAPTLTVTIDSNTDSALVISYNMSVAGRVTLAVLTASADTPTLNDMQLRSVAGAKYIHYFNHDDGNAQGTITVEGLMPYTSYIIYGLGQNTDGVMSEVISTEVVRTSDFANPEIEDFSPAKATTGVSAEILPGITFNEPVSFVAGKSILLTGLFSGYSYTVLAEDIVTSGNKVSFEHTIFPFNDYIFINIEEGAFVDASGNISPEVYTVNGVKLDWYFKTGPNPATVLENIFENFLGTYTCTDFWNGDSTSVDWGPYSVTIAEDPDVEFGVIVDNFWAWGVQAKFQFHEDGTITCAEQMLDGVDMGDIYGASYDGYPVWIKGWAPDQYLPAAGHWYYSDFSFDIALSFINDSFGQIYDDIYQLYEQPSSKNIKGNKIPTEKIFPY